MVRSSILQSHQTMKYVPFFWILIALVIIFSVAKLIFKMMYGKNIQIVYTLEKNMNLVSNLLRPSSFCLKEANKYIAVHGLNLTYSRLPFGKLFDEG